MALGNNTAITQDTSGGSSNTTGPFRYEIMQKSGTDSWTILYPKTSADISVFLDSAGVAATKTFWSGKSYASSAVSNVDDALDALATQIGNATEAANKTIYWESLEYSSSNTTKIETYITSQINNLDVSAQTIVSESSGIVTINRSITETNGKISVSDKNGITVYSKDQVDSLLTNGAKFLGTVSSADGVATYNVSTTHAGDWLRSSSTDGFSYTDASTGASTTVHVGDILIATQDTPTTSTWDIIHTEIDNNTTYSLTHSSDVSKETSALNQVTLTDNNGNATTITINNVANATSADSATKATQDASGNTITSYYQPKIAATGSATNPVYFSAAGTVAACTYALNKTVPSTAVFTDRYVNSATFAQDTTNNNVKMTLTRAGSDTSTVTANIPSGSSTNFGVMKLGDGLTLNSSGALSLPTTLTAESVFEAVKVDVYGRVTAGASAHYVGTSTTDTAPSTLAVGGIFYKRIA